MFSLCFFTGLQVEVVMGGLPVQDDIAKFKKKVHILVGSPGRLRQLVQEKYVSLTSVRLLVLDEADRLVDKSFVADINYIFNSLPHEKQVIMSSATYPETTKESINKYLQSAQHICPDADNILLGIDQRVTFVKHNVNIVKQTKFRFEELIKILSRKPFKQCLIFCNYQTRVVEVGKMLKKAKWPAEQLYGQQNQTDRLDALKTLQDYGCRILISTDLAARGIDASNVDLVINFEPPFVWQTYLHRIGRAGRFGSYGVAVTILAEGQEEHKFKTMVGEIKGSIKLKNFWDDEMFVTDLNSNMTNSTQPELTPCETANCKEKIFQKLWDTLTSPSKKDSKEVERCDSLCSFKEIKETGTNAFSDLLTSFNKHEPNNNMNEESPYQCLTQPDIPTAQCYAIINNIHTKTDMSAKDVMLNDKCQLEERSDEYNAFSINNEMLNKKVKNPNIDSKLALATAEDDIETLDHLKNGDNINNDYGFQSTNTLHTAAAPTAFGSLRDRKPINSKLGLPTAEENETRGRKENHLHNRNNSTKGFDFEEPELMDALAAAGLPTAFSSSNYRKSNNKKICKTNNKKYENSNSGPISSKTFNQNNIISNNVCNNDTGKFEATCGVTVNRKHSFKNEPLSKYSTPKSLEFNEPNTSTFRNKNASNCFYNISQSKYYYKHTYTNPLQDSDDDDDYILENKVCDNTSQYQRSEKTSCTENPVKPHNSNTKALYGRSTKYGKQDNTHKPAAFSNHKCSQETSDSDSTSESDYDTDSDSFDKPALSVEYVNWYKTLKYRTLQVELAVYVDELSKI